MSWELVAKFLFSALCVYYSLIPMAGQIIQSMLDIIQTMLTHQTKLR
jgi:hypothetical protein